MTWADVRYIIAWAVLRIFLFNIVLGGTAVLLIAYELLADPMDLRSDKLDRVATFMGTLTTFVGVIATSLSIYFNTQNPTKPDPSSRLFIAPAVIAGCLLCLYLLVTKGSVPNHIVNGFALLGIAGALFRIQPNPQRSVADF